MAKNWRNNSVPNYSTVFKSPEPFFLASFLAPLGMHVSMVPNSLQKIRATVQATI